MIYRTVLAMGRSCLHKTLRAWGLTRVYLIMTAETQRTQIEVWIGERKGANLKPLTSNR